MELAKPLLSSASSIKDREHAQCGNLGPKYMLDVKPLNDVPQPKKPKNDALQVCPYVWSDTGLVRSGIDASATLDVLAETPGQPHWWYERLENPFH